MDQLIANQSPNTVETLFRNVPNREEWDLQALKNYAESAGLDFYRVRSAKEQTILHIAAGFGRQSIVIDQIESGALVDAKDFQGTTPLHYACNHAHKSVAYMLIKAGADVNLADDRGWTALHFALSREENQERIGSSYWELAKVLIMSGANPYLKSRSSISCLSRIPHEDQRHEMRLDYLQMKLINVTCEETRERIIDKYLWVKDFFQLIKNGDGDEEVDSLKALLTRKFVTCRLHDWDNITPLHRAAGYGFVNIADLLIDAGAEVNARDDKGRIPLHNAAHHGQVDMIDLLTKKGSDVNARDYQGATPLHYAATSNSTSEPCQHLIKAGADISIRNDSIQLPYDLGRTEEIKRVLKIPELNSELIYEANLGYELKDIVGENGFLILDSCLKLIGDHTSSPSRRRMVTRIMLNENNWLFQLIKRKMLDTIGFHQGDNYTTYDIKSVELVLHNQLLNRYFHSSQILLYEGIPLSEKLLFHGSRSIGKILTQGFNEFYSDQNGMFGAAIYFASHSSKSNQYAFGLNQGCPKHNDKCCYICDREMIVAQVALGRCLNTQKELPDYRHAPPGYTSVAGKPGPNLKYPEYAIYDGKLAYPLYVIKYSIVA